MGPMCECENPAAAARLVMGCVECGRTCCPHCAVVLESAAYCRGCARRLLETPTVRPAGSFVLV